MSKMSGWINHGWLLQEVNAAKEKLQPIQLDSFDTWPTLPLISVIVAAWNEESYIQTFLTSFMNLDYPNKELILVAGGDDKTHQVAQKITDHRITLIEQQAGEGKYGALKKGFRHASGDIVYLTDVDCILNSASFAHIIYPIVTGKESAVTGPTRPLSHQMSEPFVRAQAVKLFRKMILVPNTHVSFLIGANCAIKHSLLKACLGTSEEQPIGEDYYLALSICRGEHRILYEHRSEIETRFASSFGAYVHQKSRWHRSHLLVHLQLNDRRWIGDVLTSIRSELLLIAPLLFIWLGYFGGLVWLLSWGVFFVPYMKAKILTEQLGQSTQASLPTLLKLMIADFSAWAICLPQTFFARWRHVW
jgi:cellulose synthase/poly-beta-1,6-N-acetylglucosamine synthase-like glycosyltransferase